MNLKQKVKSKLDEYLEFDSDLIFNSLPKEGDQLQVKPLVRVFGGAVRDIIADMPINDVDIIVGAKTIKRVNRVLEENGYIYMESLQPKELSRIYSDIRIINEPHTWIKGSKIVQLIRPVCDKNPSTQKQYEETFINLIQNVDMSCCGVSYDGLNVYENYPQAISHCLSKSFISNTDAKMYSIKRYQSRCYKLLDRGWNELLTIADRRQSNIDIILKTEKSEPEYIKEYEIIKNNSKLGSSKEELYDTNIFDFL